MKDKIIEYWERANLWIDRQLGISDTTYQEWRNEPSTVDMSNHPTPEEFERR